MSIPKPTGRLRQWAVDINGYVFPVASNRGIPAWDVSRVADVEGETGGVQDKERRYRSTHSGFGWGQYMGPNTYHYATSGANGADARGGLDPRFAGSVILGPLVYDVRPIRKDTSVGVTGFFEIGSYLYAISGKWVNRIDPSTDAVTDSASFPYDLTTSNSGAVGTVGVRFDGNIVIGVTASPADMVSFDGTTFTVLNGANVPSGSYLATYYADTDEVLACCFLSSSNPSLAWIAQAAALNTGTNWTGYGGDYGVGDTSVTLTGLTAIERTLYIGTSAGAYYLNGQTTRSPLLIPALPRSSTNGVNLRASDEGQIWYPCDSGLYVHDPNAETIDNVAPGRGQPDRSGIAGTYTAMATFRAWTYLAVYDGTDSYIMCGRRREEGEPGYGAYIWHGSMMKFTGTKVTAMHLSSLVSPPRLWFGLLDGNVAYIRLPSNGDNPLLDSTYRYASTGSLIYPADDYDSGGMRWHLSDVALEVEGLTGASMVQIFERRDLGTWTSLGTVTSNGRTVIQTTGDKRFNRCELRLDVENGASTSTPVIRVLVGKASRRPTYRNVISTTLLCFDDAVSRMGLSSRYTAQTLLEQLEALDNYYPVTLKDYWTGKEQQRQVLVTSLHERVVEQEGDEAVGLAVDVTMKVLGTAGVLLTEGGDVLTTESGLALALE